MGAGESAREGLPSDTRADEGPLGPQIALEHIAALGGLGSGYRRSPGVTQVRSCATAPTTWRPPGEMQILTGDVQTVVRLRTARGGILFPRARMVRRSVCYAETRERRPIRARTPHSTRASCPALCVQLSPGLPPRSHGEPPDGWHGRWGSPIGSRRLEAGPFFMQVWHGPADPCRDL